MEARSVSWYRFILSCGGKSAMSSCVTFVLCQGALRLLPYCYVTNVYILIGGSFWNFGDFKSILFLLSWSLWAETFVLVAVAITTTKEENI
jgi:hypothetical protein